jgi:hypothetical protein
MIAKGNLHAHGQKLAAYLITGKMGERAELVELRGFASSNIREAFTDVMIQAEATRCEKPFFHCYIRLPDHEMLSREQWQHVADRIERQLGFEGQGRAIAFHHDRKSGETHMHMAWSRIDLDTMKAIDPGLYKNKLKEVSRQLEKELGLTRLENDRDPKQKTQAPARSEFEQSRRLGTDLKAIRETIRACWERSDNGRSFEAALAGQGCILARGDKRDFVVVDHAGGDHALGKRITGATAAETRAKLVDIDKALLPSVAHAKAMQAERARRAPEIAPQRQSTIETSPAVTAAPKHVQTREASPAPSAPQSQQAAPTAPARDAGMRQPGDVATRVTGGMLKALGAMFEGLANMIAPPPPPTKDQAERAGRVAEENDRDQAFRRFVAEQVGRGSGGAYPCRSRSARAAADAARSCRRRRRACRICRCAVSTQSRAGWRRLCGVRNSAWVVLPAKTVGGGRCAK